MCDSIDSDSIHIADDQKAWNFNRSWEGPIMYQIASFPRMISGCLKWKVLFTAMLHSD